MIVDLKRRADAVVVVVIVAALPVDEEPLEECTKQKWMRSTKEEEKER